MCFVNSYVNPAHEIRMREILEEELPSVATSTSAEILPEIFEHDPFNTTVANAVLAPLVSGYVKIDILIRLVRSPDNRMPMTRLATEAALASGGLPKVADRLAAAQGEQLVVLRCPITSASP